MYPSHDGAPVWSADYTAFGDRTIGATGKSSNTLQYTGRENDGTGLYYYRARYYDPSIGRFISEDPLGFQAGINFYAYVNNNPVNGNDPSGKCPACIAALIDTAPEWGPPVLAAGRVVWNFLRPGLITGSVNATSNALVSLATGGSQQDAQINFTTGFVAGALMPYVPGAGTFAQGASLNALADYASQGISAQQSGKLFSPNWGEVSGAFLGGGAGAHLTKDFGYSLAEQTSGGIASFAPNIGMQTVGQQLGTRLQPALLTVPVPSVPLIGDFSSPSGVGSFTTGAGGAAGGFLLYPNKPNTNQLQHVYGKP